MGFQWCQSPRVALKDGRGPSTSLLLMTPLRCLWIKTLEVCTHKLPFIFRLCCDSYFFPGNKVLHFLLTSRGSCEQCHQEGVTASPAHQQPAPVRVLTVLCLEPHLGLRKKQSVTMTVLIIEKHNDDEHQAIWKLRYIFALDNITKGGEILRVIFFPFCYRAQGGCRFGRSFQELDMVVTR